MSGDLQLYRLLAEVLRLQRWAATNGDLAARIFGLMHGVESVLDEERARCVSRIVEKKIEDLLEEVESGKQPVDGPAIKSRIKAMGIEERDARIVMELCWLESRFVDAIEQIASALGTAFPGLTRQRSAEQNWHGALHYVELVDTTEAVHRTLHSTFSPCVPRVGEYVKPESGSLMRVIGVHHIATSQSGNASNGGTLLVPHVLLEVVEEGDPE